MLKLMHFALKLMICMLQLISFVLKSPGCTSQNCLRTIPGLVELHRKYSAHGLGMIAYHRPELCVYHKNDDYAMENADSAMENADFCTSDFETETANLERFVSEWDVPYLVGLDNDDAAWEAW